MKDENEPARHEWDIINNFFLQILSNLIHATLYLHVSLASYLLHLILGCAIGLTDEQVDKLQVWWKKFSGKYPAVGYIVVDNDEHGRRPQYDNVPHRLAECQLKALLVGSQNNLHKDGQSDDVGTSDKEPSFDSNDSGMCSHYVWMLSRCL
jgi:hypothetical protein